ncbi:hypothetical protein [Arcticibacter eurypsychrophilus]|uniref:hypothetical protein n=1 Tax=Arcticibacter eurypsychrophilus TaxID=1434752 RepID=UPI001112CD56|nr:hypothetical protein [Arcticibacter eurypsychrophilus]
MKGGFEYILVHVEIEGGNKPGFEKRMFQYQYRLTDRFGIPVEALAVFTGERNQRRPGQYHEKLIFTEILFKYKAYQIFDHTHEELLGMDNPFSLIILAAQKALLEGKIPEEELGEERLTIARTLIDSGKYNHEKIARFIIFLKNLVYIKDPKINRIFDIEVDTLMGRSNVMGIIETINELNREEGFEMGLEKGRVEEKAEFTKNLLSSTDLSVSKIAGLVGVTEDFVREISASLKI